MNILYASETSNWLKNNILCEDNKFECRVRMIFDHSFVLQVGGQNLIHITESEDNLSPFSLLVNGVKNFNVSEKEKIRFLKNCFIFEEFIIDINDSLMLFDESLISPVKELNFEPESHLECSKVFLGKYLRIRKKLVSALESADSDKIVSNVLQILGLGEGLTPAGDDYLLGLIYGLYSAGDNSIINVLKNEIMSEIGKNTGIISKEFLIHALNARFSKTIVNHNWKKLLHYGHNSGYFVLWGIYDSVNAFKKCLSLN